MKTNTSISDTIDIQIVFQRTKILYLGPDDREITWTYYYDTDFENIIFEELKELIPGKFDPGKFQSVAQKFTRLLGIDEIIELYKNHCIYLYIKISRETSRYPWNLLRFLYKNIFVFPVLDVETSQLKELALKKINFLIIANMNYFATNENLLLFEEELQSIRNRLEPSRKGFWPPEAKVDGGFRLAKIHRLFLATKVHKGSQRKKESPNLPN